MFAGQATPTEILFPQRTHTTEILFPQDGTPPGTLPQGRGPQGTPPGTIPPGPAWGPAGGYYSPEVGAAEILFPQGTGPEGPDRDTLSSGGFPFDSRRDTFSSLSVVTAEILFLCKVGFARPVTTGCSPPVLLHSGVGTDAGY